MNRAEKTEWSSIFKEKLSKSKVAIFADYKGLTSMQADELRKQLRAKDTEVKVLKNNMARQAVKDGSLGAETQSLMDEVVGPTLVAFSYGDPAAAAKVIHSFSKDNEALVIKDSLLGRRRIAASQIEALASLPGREVLLAKLLGTMNAPIQSFASVLAAVPRGLVTVLSAIERKKAEGGQQ